MVRRPIMNMGRLQIALTALLGHCKELLASGQLHDDQQAKLEKLIWQIEEVLDE